MTAIMESLMSKHGLRSLCCMPHFCNLLTMYFQKNPWALFQSIQSKLQLEYFGISSFYYIDWNPYTCEDKHLLPWVGVHVEKQKCHLLVWNWDQETLQNHHQANCYPLNHRSISLKMINSFNILITSYKILDLYLLIKPLGYLALILEYPSRRCYIHPWHVLRSFLSIYLLQDFHLNTNIFPIFFFPVTMYCLQPITIIEIILSGFCS